MKEGRIKIALDNDITFIIKVCQKYLLTSENHTSYLVFLGDSDDMFYLYGCYIFKKKIVKKVLNNLENIKICLGIVFSVESIKKNCGIFKYQQPSIKFFNKLI